MTTFEQLTRMAIAGLRPDRLPTEDEISELLDRLSLVFSASSELVDQVRRELLSRYQVRMDVGTTLVDNDDHEPWVSARRGENDEFYWQRYRTYLIDQKRWPPLVVTSLNQSLIALLDLLGDPCKLRPWKRRGLVVGDVQSGKTASYAGLLCMAADAGYRAIILLTGTLENVRRQTQERLDESFVGIDSSEFLAQQQQKRLVGVGVGDPRRTGIVL